MVFTKAQIETISHFLHKNLLWLLLGSYAFAAILPGPALALRDISFGKVVFFQETTRITLPMVMLAFLLLNAGLGIQASELKNLWRKPRILLAGVAGNFFVPLLFIFCASLLLRLYHDVDEAQQVLVGLALVAAMPIAGSSTAWAQNSNGDLSLSLGLVLISTILSPLTTPLAFDLVDRMAIGEYAQTLDQLEKTGRGFLLIACVLLPSILGIGCRSILGEKKTNAIRPTLKVVNSINLILLNYSNAGVSLPHLFTHPDPDLFVLIFGAALLLCISSFVGGWFLSNLLRATLAQRTSLMFGMGMNNNGTSLVLASLTLSHYPRVLLPIIFYNLIQHLIAGFVDRFVVGKAGREKSR